MKLCTYNVGGTPITQLGGYSDSDLSGNKPFIPVLDSDSVPVDYTEISSISNWASFGASAGCDYKVIRKAISVIAFVTGWANLSQSEKEIAAEYFAVGATERAEIFTDPQVHLQKGVEFHRLSVAARQARVSTVEAVFYSSMALTDAFTLVASMEIIANRYVNWGLETKSTDGVDALFDYINSNVGSIYEGAGIAESGITLITGETMPQFVTRLNNILVEGYY